MKSMCAQILVIFLVSTSLVASEHHIRAGDVRGVPGSISEALRWHKLWYGGFFKDSCFSARQIYTINIFKMPPKEARFSKGCDGSVESYVAHVQEMGLAFDVKHCIRSDRWYADIVGDSDSNDCNNAGELARWEKRYMEEGYAHKSIHTGFNISGAQKEKGFIAKRTWKSIVNGLKKIGESDTSALLVSSLKNESNRELVYSRTKKQVYFIELPLADDATSLECVRVFRAASYKGGGNTDIAKTIILESDIKMPSR